MVYNQKQILESWVRQQLEDISLRDDLISNEELSQQSDQFLSNFLEIYNSDNKDLDAEEFDTIKETLADISISRSKQGFSPRETSAYIFSLKKVFLDILMEGLKNEPEKFYNELIKINNLIDSLATFTFETYIKGKEEVIFRQSSDIAEISTPVIRVWDGIVALPIIGTLDSARTQTVMENLLLEIVNSGSNIAILDISGVPAVDSLVAQHLIKTVSATRLMGAECIISGIRPEIAQTIIHLGIDLTNIVTKASLANALKYAFALLKLEIKNIN